jgi:hypothetical protein
MNNLKNFYYFSDNFQSSNFSEEISQDERILFSAENGVKHTYQKNNFEQFTLVIDQQSTYFKNGNESFQGDKADDDSLKLNGQKNFKNKETNNFHSENVKKEKNLVKMGSSLLEKGTHEYEKRRRSNNEAVKRSRNKWIQKHNENKHRLKELQDENENLKSLVLSLQKELNEIIKKSNKMEQGLTKTITFNENQEFEVQNCSSIFNDSILSTDEIDLTIDFLFDNQSNSSTKNTAMEIQDLEKALKEIVNQGSSNHIPVPVFENASKKEENLSSDSNQLKESDLNKIFDQFEIQTLHAEFLSINPKIFDAHFNFKNYENPAKFKEAIQSDKTNFDHVNLPDNLIAIKNNDFLPFDFDQVYIEDLF